MTEKDSFQDKSAKSQEKETSYNLLKTIMSSPDIKDINQTPNYISHLQIPQNKIINKNVNNQLSSDNNTNNKGKNNTIIIMQDMKKNISNNNYKAIKELLDSQNISQQAKNQLLNFAFTKLDLTNNNIQKQIILELMEHGADPNHKLKFDISEKSKSNNSSIPKNIKVTPLIYCCIKGDYELFDLIKDKINLSSNYEENNVYNINKNYFFFFFENNQNIEKKYKIASSIFQKNKENKNFKININDRDKQTGMSLLMLSVVRQYPNFIKLFLENGADVNLTNLIDGDTALHYAAKIKNKKIIELLLEDKNCDLLIKNNKNETIIDVANYNSANTEIYSLLAEKYGEQQKILEEGGNNKINQNNKDDKVNKNNVIVNGKNEIINTSKKSNSNNVKNKDDNGKDILKVNQAKKNIEQLNSYIEIPFQFTNNSFNFVDFYDANSKNKIENGSNEIKMNNGSNRDENDSGSIKNYMKLKGTPILNINLGSKEDEDRLMIENLKEENEEFDVEFEKVEKKLETIYKEHNKLLKELSEVNNEIKSVNGKLDSYSKKFQDKENKYLNSLEKLKTQEKNQNKILEVLLTQKKFLEMNQNHKNFLYNMNYLNKKFSDEPLDEKYIDKYIKENLQRDILDFQLYVETNIKMKQKPINEIRSSLQEILERNGYDYTVYVFGSFETGLSLPWSDLDLILVSKNQSKNTIVSEDKLKEIQSLLGNANWINKPILVTNYRVFPYITFSTDEKHGFMKVNLTIQDKNNYGYKCAKLTKKFVETYENLKPIVLVLKHLFKYANTLFSLSGFSENEKDNLNSYSVILMVAFFIQFHIMERNKETVNNPKNLGELFINFLIFYINYNQEFIFVRQGLEDTIENSDFLLLKESQSNFVVIDPIDHKKNVLAKDIDFNSIKSFFRLILHSSKIKCDCSCHYLKDYNDKNGNKENSKNVELGTEHCILKKLFKTANRINLLNI